MQDNISKIKDRLDIADVVSGYIKLQKAGVNFKAPCPFHNEKTPSFYVTPERQIWHCFGCQKGGDMFTFVQEIENVDFAQALRILAEKAGIQLETFESPKKDASAILFDICELATKFFEVQLEKSSSGIKAMEYLTQRGLLPETIKEFRLGFAPKDWRSLSDFLKTKGFKQGEIVASGLALNSQQSSGIYDRFRSRIIFPIADATGRVVGFTGRIFNSDSDKEEAKYINTPQTSIYDKSRILYGLNRAKSDIKREGRCLLVEGNMDAITSYQAGVRNVVATSGTALTEHHLKMLARFTKNLDFSFDTDKAGAMATRRGIGLALAQEFAVNAVSIDDPECKDPADYVKKHGSAWKDLVLKAKPVLEFYFDKSRRTFDPRSAESKTAFLKEVAPFIKRLTSKVERSHWISQLAFLFQANEKDIESDLNRVKDDLEVYHSPNLKEAVANKVAIQNIPIDVLDEAIVSIVLKDPIPFRGVIKEEDWVDMDLWTSEILKKISEYVGETFDFDAFLSQFNDNSRMRVEAARIRAQEMWSEFSNEDLIQEFNFLINRAKWRRLKAQLSSLAYDIGKAERDRDVGASRELAIRFSEIASRLASIEKTNTN